MKNKFRSYKFWISLLAGVIVLINTLGTVFGFIVNELAITSIATAVLGILVILGFVKNDEVPENKSEEDIKQDDVEEVKSNLEKQEETINKSVKEKEEEIAKKIDEPKE
ncbi:MAG: hypothetical protein KBT30_02820 [Clostridiales bacterium]|nr:hypothetical protein [Candidatus Apopatousia equi]